MANIGDTVSLLLGKGLVAWQKYDAAVSSTVFDGLERVGFGEIKGAASPLQTLPFVSSPTPLVTFISAYIIIVLLGLKFRRPASADHQDPLWLKAVIQIHNLNLIVLSTYMASAAVYRAISNKYTFWGTGYNPSEKDMANVIYIFFLSKLYEVVDTMIMLLKGKLGQVSFLHVYHHASISIIWWVISYSAPGGDAWYSCFLNSFVHIWMYLYYLLASAFGGDAKKRQKYLWWGRYLTQFQMFQFVTMMAQAAYCWAYSPYPKFMSRLLFFYMWTLLALFANFYVKKHSGKGGPKRKRKAN